MSRSAKSNLELNSAGFILLNKAAGITSFRAIEQLKRQYNIKKLGHTGTLDSFATGLLVVLCNQATKLVSYVTKFNKSYRASIQFGIETDTLDPTGRQVRISKKTVSLEALETALPDLLRMETQIPPQFSAIHSAGKRASQLARRGEQIELAPRKVRLLDYEILSWDAAKYLLELRIHCSKGYYVRALARDLGLAVSSCAHLKALERSSVGPFSLSGASDLHTFNSQTDLFSLTELCSQLPNIILCSIKTASRHKLSYGKKLNLDDLCLPMDDSSLSAGGESIYGLIEDLELGSASKFLALLRREALSSQLSYLANFVPA